MTISENAPTTNGLPSSDRCERASKTRLVGYRATGKCTSIGCSGRPRPPWSRLGISSPGSTAWPVDATAHELAWPLGGRARPQVDPFALLPEDDQELDRLAAGVGQPVGDPGVELGRPPGGGGRPPPPPRRAGPG